MSADEKELKCRYCDVPAEFNPDSLRRQLTECQCELKNFQDIVRFVIPTSGENPLLPGIEVFGKSIALNGLVGGDHIIYVDFNKRYDMDRLIAEAKKEGRTEAEKNLRRCMHKAGVLLADVSGHRITDAVLAAMLHQAFLLGVQYELKHNGEITIELFEKLNTRFFHSSSQFKYITMIYGEISETGNFRFLSAAHPPPIVFSREFDRIVCIGSEKMIHFPPVGSMPSVGNWEAKPSAKRAPLKERYAIQEIDLMGKGDILILFSDGLSEHVNEKDEYYFPERLEKVLKRFKEDSAQGIFSAVQADMLAFSPAQDDVSFIVIKKG